MKKLLIIVTILFVKLTGFAQVLGNEWIKANQPYFKIKIVEQGVYKIDSSSLAQLGVNLLGLNTNRFQLFKNGEEQPIFINGGNDNQINTNDYILFYGNKNDGKLDEELYKTPADQPHQFNNLFTDTAIYFLTILPLSSSQIAKRFIPFNDNNYSAYLPENYFIKEVIIAPIEDYNEGGFENVGLGEFYYFSDYTNGESWMGYKIGLGENKVYNLNTPFVYNLGPNARLESKVFGVSNDRTKAINHHLRIGIANDNVNYATIKDTTYSGYIETKYQVDLNNTLLGVNTQLKFETVADLGLSSDLSSLSYLSLKYASLCYFANGTSNLFFKHNAQQSSNRIYFQFSGYNKSNPFVLDLTTNKIISATVASGTLKALAENANMEQSFYIYDETDIKPCPQLQQIEMNYLSANLNTEFIIISNKALETGANSYKNYRSQRFNTNLVFSNDLYNQFFYGYEHPLAIKHFLSYLYQNQTIKPSYVLLLGRGYQNKWIRNNFQEAYKNNLVPAIGQPSSDNLFTAGFDATKPYTPAIATGRIPAATNDEVLNYLNKLITYEKDTIFDINWRKQVLHVSGGSGSEQKDYTNQINGNKAQIENAGFGANVISFNKNSSATVQTDFKPALIKELNSGKGLMTFLGHGSLSVLDVDFGRISDMQNTNKYTFFYFNGCNIGNANDADPLGSGNIYGKDFIVAPNKGAIGWLAHSNITLTRDLFQQMDVFYSNLSTNMYGNSVGKILQQSIAELTNNGGIFQISHGYQLLYQGDPALRLGSPSLPDYEITNSDIYFTDNTVTALADSFEINVILKNLGKAINDTLMFRIEHTITSTGSKFVYDSLILKSPFYSDTLTVKLKGQGKIMAGDNQFLVKVDNINAKVELNENNNEVIINKFIPGSGITAMFPLNYSIINSDTVELTVINSDLQATNKDYIFEIDNSIAFNNTSAFYQNSGIIKANDLAKWKAVLKTNDSIVYFWRAKLNVPENQGGVWVESSFTKINSVAFGFMQSNFDQFSDVSNLDKIIFDSINKQMEFVNTELVLGIQNKRFDHRNMGVIIPYQLNEGVGTCPGNTVVALVFEPNQVEIPYEIPTYPFNCTFVQNNKQNRSRRYYTFGTNTSTGRDEFRTFIDNIPSGYYVAIFSRYNSDINNWDANTLNSLSKLGSVKIPQIKSNNTAWAIISKKDAQLGYAAEDTINNDSLGALVNAGLIGLPPGAGEPQDTKLIVINKTLLTKLSSGSITSKAFGPAQNWSKLHFDFNETDFSLNSKLSVDIIGVTSKGDSILYSNITTSNFDLSLIDAKIIPYLKLKLNMEDSTKRTPQQFGYWQLLGSPVAEAKLAPNIAFSLKNNPIEEGDSLQIELGIENISQVIFDSNNVNIKIVDELRNTKFATNLSTPKLNPQGNFILKTKLPTIGLSNNNQIQFSLNNSRTIQEINYVNNYLASNFMVNNDKSNPYIDITFDGVKIMSGDIVSATPSIQITSADNNKFILQNDTSGFIVMLRRPNSFDYERINLNSGEIRFEPATNSKNKATIYYKPVGLIDGDYGLKVQAIDAKGNLAGNNDYEINFKIINNSSITQFFPYPNPATTNVRFIFTLTGSKIPDDLLIRIMTVTGKVVKEITKQEFGNIKFGNNISEFAWDGNDMYGDRLANGVYIYQVFTKINEQNIENLKVKNTDKYFTQGAGKIYLMR